VRQTRGCIGYVELAYALQTKMSYGALRNRDGNFVSPTQETTRAAAENAIVPSDFYVRFTYSKGKDSYPIAGFTYLILKKSTDKSKLSAIVKFTEWAYKNGNKDAEGLNYIPLPDSLKTKVLKAVEKL
jgi:phosphate transport system substrate-binding protein